MHGGLSSIQDSLDLNTNSKDGFGACVHGGYRPNDYFALDLSYLDSGTVVIGEVAPSNEREARLEAASLRALIDVGHHRLEAAPDDNQFLNRLFFQFGGGVAWYRLEETNFGVTTRDSGWSKVSMYLGLGCGLTEHLDASLGFETIVGLDRPDQLGGKAEFDMITIGMSYNF